MFTNKYYLLLATVIPYSPYWKFVRESDNKRLNETPSIFTNCIQIKNEDFLRVIMHPEQQIPSIKLAENEKCNPATVQKAMKVLEEQNLVTSCGTLGYFVIASEQEIKR